MKKRLTLFLFTLFIMAFMLQGCSEAETSIKVTVNEKGDRVEATLKSDQSKGYKWTYFTKEGKLTESASDFRNDIFNDTYTQKYGFVISEKEEDVVYFVLYQTDQLEKGRVFEYEISYNDDGDVVLGQLKEHELKNKDDLMKSVKELEGL